MLDTLVGMLSGEFDVVAAVADGTSAVTRAAELEPDLLVLDIAMPGLNGIAAAARLLPASVLAGEPFVSPSISR
jgi:CheY-like chemotaxis protein